MEGKISRTYVHNNNSLKLGLSSESHIIKFVAIFTKKMCFKHNLSEYWYCPKTGQHSVLMQSLKDFYLLFTEIFTIL